ncbi:MAG: 50S ribosomal protein L23 [Chitinophagales bacterium]|mgnify:FL=1|jgi:large subunit ribosomal protein L23|nr:50S ribosomal protein L23 [Chitinophagaceae bacterium]MBP9884419.1 50S ribosomal protein L23 [Chitinophagales bacterium]
MAEILIRPLISEKLNALSQKYNKVGFVVARNANKIQIKNVVEKMYGVTVKSVSTSLLPGKTKQRSTRKGVSTGMKSPIKKAYVTLAKGEAIDFYANI